MSHGQGKAVRNSLIPFFNFQQSIWLTFAYVYLTVLSTSVVKCSSRHTPWSNVGLRALLKGPNSCADLGHTRDRTTDLARSKSISLTATLQAAFRILLTAPPTRRIHYSNRATGIGLGDGQSQSGGGVRYTGRFLNQWEGL